MFASAPPTFSDQQLPIHSHAPCNLPDPSPIAMACSSRPPQLQPPPPSRPRPPPPQPPHLDTTLTLALPPRSLLSPRPPHARPAGCATASSELTGDTPLCPECGRPFPSSKALFGHMRSHPERTWRGMKPPPQFRHGALGGAPLAAADQFTAQERDVAGTLVMLAGARPGGGKGKKRMSVLASSSRAKESGSTSPSSPTVPAPPRCGGEHKCGACARVFSTGQSLGRHKRGNCAEAAVVATPASCGSAMPMSEAPDTTLLDLNLPPPGTPLPRMSDEGGRLNAALDLKLGY